MGFSLQHFMDELVQAINNDKPDLVEELKAKIRWNYDYAAQCGHIEHNENTAPNK